MQMDQPPISLVQFYDHGTKFNQVLKVSCVHVRHGVHSLHFPHNTEYSLALYAANQWCIIRSPYTDKIEIQHCSQVYTATFFGSKYLP